MMNRDIIIQDLRAQITRVGLTDSSEKVLKVAVLAGVTKLVITGKSKYQVVDWLNKQRRASGPDMWYVFDWVYMGDQDKSVKEAWKGLKEVDF